MKYYILNDEKFNGEIFRKKESIYERFVYGPNKWVESSLFEKYLNPKSKVYGKYIEKNEKDIINTLAKQIEDYERLWNIAYTLSNKIYEKNNKTKTSYLFHPLHIAKKFDVYDFKIVAILKDSLKNEEVTLKDLEDYGFPKKIIEAIDSITKRKNEEYFDYIKRLKNNYIAKKVKIEDLKYRLSLMKTNKLENEKLEQKYNKALKILEN